MNFLIIVSISCWKRKISVTGLCRQTNIISSTPNPVRKALCVITRKRKRFGDFAAAAVASRGSKQKLIVSGRGAGVSSENLECMQHASFYARKLLEGPRVNLSKLLIPPELPEAVIILFLRVGAALVCNSILSYQHGKFQLLLSLCFPLPRVIFKILVV